MTDNTSKTEPMKIYISGPITGRPEANQRFKEMETFLQALGLQAVNPFTWGLQEDSATWEEHMAHDLILLSGCTHILLLRGWQYSRGARLELAMARKLGLKEITLNDR